MNCSNSTNNDRWYQIHIYSNLTFYLWVLLFIITFSETINYKISYSSIVVES